MKMLNWTSISQKLNLVYIEAHFQLSKTALKKKILVPECCTGIAETWKPIENRLIVNRIQYKIAKNTT